MFTREQALELLHKNMQNQNLRRHCYAVEVVMRSLAKHFYPDDTEPVEVWGIVGLLHDGDYEETKSDPSKHTVKMSQWLKDQGENDPEILAAILSHNFAHTGENPPQNNLEWSLYCCDELTGLIVAVALVRPEKKLNTVSIESVMKKWEIKAFAAGVHREQIALCEEKLGIPLHDFVAIVLQAMQDNAKVLGL